MRKVLEFFRTIGGALTGTISGINTPFDHAIQTDPPTIEEALANKAVDDTAKRTIVFQKLKKKGVIGYYYRGETFHALTRERIVEKINRRFKENLTTNDLFDTFDRLLEERIKADPEFATREPSQSVKFDGLNKVVSDNL